MSSRTLLCCSLAALTAGSIAAAPAQQDLGIGMGIPTSIQVCCGLVHEYSVAEPNQSISKRTAVWPVEYFGRFRHDRLRTAFRGGLVQNPVSGFVRQELDRPYTFVNRLSGTYELEASRSRSLFETIWDASLLGGSARPIFAEMSSLQADDGTYLLPSADSLLKDRPSTIESLSDQTS